MRGSLLQRAMSPLCHKRTSRPTQLVMLTPPERRRLPVRRQKQRVTKIAGRRLPRPVTSSLVDGVSAGWSFECQFLTLRQTSLSLRKRPRGY